MQHAQQESRTKELGVVDIISLASDVWFYNKPAFELIRALKEMPREAYKIDEMACYLHPAHLSLYLDTLLELGANINKILPRMPQRDLNLRFEELILMDGIDLVLLANSMKAADVTFHLKKFRDCGVKINDLCERFNDDELCEFCGALLANGLDANRIANRLDGSSIATRLDLFISYGASVEVLANRLGKELVSRRGRLLEAGATEEMLDYILETLS